MSSGNAIANNTASKNDYAVYLWDAHDNIISDNDLQSNDGCGITLFFSDENRFEGNDARHNCQWRRKIVQLWRDKIDHLT